MWDPQQLTTLEAYTACYKDSFMFFSFYHEVMEDKAQH
jgi:hypothetical protein